MLTPSSFMCVTRLCLCNARERQHYFNGAMDRSEYTPQNNRNHEQKTWTLSLVIGGNSGNFSTRATLSLGRLKYVLTNRSDEEYKDSPKPTM